MHRVTRLTNGFKIFSDEAKALDSQHGNIGVSSSKSTLEASLKKLNVLTKCFFISDKPLVLEPSGPDNLMLALCYMDYILRYLLFKFQQPKCMSMVSKELLDMIQCEAEKLDSTIQTKSQYLKVQSGLRIRSIRATIKNFRMLKQKHKTIPKDPKVFLQFGLDNEIKKEFMDFYHVAIAPPTDQCYPALLPIKRMAAVLEKIRPRNAVPYHVLDVVLSATLHFIVQHAEIIRGNRTTGRSYFRSICQSCLDISATLTIYTNLKIPFLHRFGRAGMICVLTGMEISDLEYFSDIRKKPKPVFVKPPKKNEIVSDFWQLLLSKFDTNIPDSFYCAICCSDCKMMSKSVILDKCSHTFCLECIQKWFGSRPSCPKCRLEIKSYTSTALALPYLTDPGEMNSRNPVRVLRRSLINAQNAAFSQKRPKLK